MDESSKRKRKRKRGNEVVIHKTDWCSVFTGMTSVLDQFSSTLFPSPLNFCICQNLYSYLQADGNNCSYKGIPCEESSHLPLTVISY